MSGNIIDIFGPFSKDESFPAGSVIFDEGSESDRFFFVEEGEVEIRKVLDKEEDRYKLVAVIGEGEFFGEIAAFLGQPRTAQAVAKTGVKLLGVNKSDVSEFLKSNPEKAFSVMEAFSTVLMRRLADTTSHLAAIYETGRLVTISRSRGELVENVMENTFRTIKSADGALFVRYNPFNDDFEIGYSIGVEQDEAATVSKNDPLIVKLSAEKEVFVSHDLRVDGRITLSEISPYAGAKSLIAAPLISEDKLTGLIVFLNRSRAHAFTQAHLILLSAMSGYVSVALENLERLQDELDRIRYKKAKGSISF